jgi:Domain of unknown function (DUF4352)
MTDLPFYYLGMNRRGVTVPLAALLAVAACAAVIFLSLNRAQPVSRTIIGPSTQPSDSGQQPIGPHLDEVSGALTIQVGDTALFNGVGFEVTNMTAPYSDTSSQPQKGEFVRLDVEIRNTEAAGGSPFDVSAKQSFELQDDGGSSYSGASLQGVPGPPDGKLVPGTSLQGSLIYDLPSGHTYRLLYKNELLSNGEIITNLGRI